MRPHGSHREWALRGWLAVLWLTFAVFFSVWLSLPELHRAPVHALAGVLVAAGFASTAGLLFHQDHQRGNAWLFVLLTVVWWCDVLTQRPAGFLTSVLFVVGVQVDVVAVAVLLRYPADRLDRTNRLFVVVIATVCALLRTVETVTNTPRSLRLPQVPWPTLVHDPHVGAIGRELTGTWLSAAAVVFVVLLLRRWLMMAPLERRTLTPIVVTAAFVAIATTPLVLGTVLSTAHMQVVYLIRSYGAVAVAIAFVASALGMRLARSALVTLVNHLEVPSTAASVQSALRQALLDDELVVYFALPGSPGWYDDQGRRHDLPADDERRMPVVTTTGDGEPLAAILVDPRLDRYRTLLDAAVTVSRFALENARLEAGLRAQLIAVREARARLLSAGLQQRRQLERDLHDGAQQRLLAIGLRLGALETTVADDPDTATAVGMVRKELHVALEELRDLARGIYPAVLSQAGLGPALEGIAERLPLHVEMHVEPARRPPDVENAAYLVVCEALTNAVRHAGECTVRVDVREEAAWLRVRVADDGAGSEQLNQPSSLRGLRDRVTALGGDLRVSSARDSGTVVEAVLPCA